MGELEGEQVSKSRVHKGPACPTCPIIRWGALYSVKFPERLGYSTTGKSERGRNPFIIGETPLCTFVFRMTLMNVVIIWEAEDDEKD